MCEFHTLTVMTTDPQLRKTLREEITASTINSSKTRTRDPTYAREHFNNFARMPYIQRTSNTLAAPTAAKRILRGVSRPTESSNNNKQPHHDSYDQTMRKHKGCRTNTAPSGKPETSERPTRPERPETPPPKNPVCQRSTTPQQATARQHVAAEAIMLHANALTNRQNRLRTSKATTRFREGKTKTSQKSERSERSERHERPTRPERLKTRPPKIPKLHQVHQNNPTGIPPEQSPRKIQVNAELLRVRTTTMREGVTKTSKKSNRSDRSKRPDKRTACAPPNHPRRLQLLQSPRLCIRRRPGLTSINDNQVVFIENAGEKRVRAHLKLALFLASKQASEQTQREKGCQKRKGCVSTQKLGNYLSSKI